MNSKYLVHNGGGVLNPNEKGTSAIAFNWGITTPIAADPRTIISIWGEDDPEAYGALSGNELYAGLQIYCLNDKKLRLCRWVPEGTTEFNIEDCVWEVLHNDGSVTWTSVEDFVPEKDIDEQISEKLLTNWKHYVNPNTTYWTICDSEDIDKNEILKNCTGITDNINGTFTALQVKNGKATTLQTGSDPEKIIGKRVSIVVPNVKSLSADIEVDGNAVQCIEKIEKIVYFDTTTTLYNESESRIIMTSDVVNSMNIKVTFKSITQ